MKKTFTLILALVVCLSLCACGGSKTTGTTAAAKAERPSSQDIVDEIKDEFKDPASVYLTNGYIAPVKHGDVESDTEFYIIATVHAKNSFGGYADPQAYLIYWNDGYCTIKEEYNSSDFPQKKFSELGCGPCYSLN